MTHIDKVKNDLRHRVYCQKTNRTDRDDERVRNSIVNRATERSTTRAMLHQDVERGKRKERRETDGIEPSLLYG